MNGSFASGLIVLAGLALLTAALAAHAVLLEPVVWTMVLAAAGALLTAVGVARLRAELTSMFRRRRGEIALGTLGLIGVLIALAYPLAALALVAVLLAFSIWWLPKLWRFIRTMIERIGQWATQWATRSSGHGTTSA